MCVILLDKQYYPSMFVCVCVGPGGSKERQLFLFQTSTLRPIMEIRGRKRARDKDRLKERIKKLAVTNKAVPNIRTNIHSNIIKLIKMDTSLAVGGLKLLHRNHH